MSDAKHTPGPWRFVRWAGRKASVTSLANRTMAVAVAIRPRYMTDDEWEPIARLIAAAPDMRAALRAEQAWRDFYKTDIDPADPDYDSATELWHYEEGRLCDEADRLRAIALAKAEGREGSDE